MSGVPVIAFERVSLWVEEHQFLDRADLTVARGEALVVAGLPGCGKSFIPRLVLGLPGMGMGESVRLEGRVLVNGASVADMSTVELRQWRCQVGAVMRSGGLIENMDIRHNIGLPLDYHCRERLEASAIDARCRLLLADMGLSELDVTGLRPVSLNREQRLYVALARALVAEPSLLLMDDPATGLSPASVDRIVDYCLRYTPDFGDRQDGDRQPGEREGTRVVTTNDLSRYLAHGSRFVMLSEGRLVNLGDGAATAACGDARVQELLVRDPAAEAALAPGTAGQVPGGRDA